MSVLAPISMAATARSRRRWIWTASPTSTRWWPLSRRAAIRRTISTVSSAATSCAFSASTCGEADRRPLRAAGGRHGQRVSAVSGSHLHGRRRAVGELPEGDGARSEENRGCAGRVLLRLRVGPNARRVAGGPLRSKAHAGGLHLAVVALHGVHRFCDGTPRLGYRA